MKTPAPEHQDKIAGTARASTGQAAEPSWRLLDWFVFNATVFVAAGCIMTVEILSTRLAARFLGSSLYTWTSAIGVVLAGISLGNYIGGRLADRFHPRRTLSLLFILASLLCLTIPMMNNAVGRWEALNVLTWPTRIFLHFVLAFLLPATLLGTMSPVVAKMALGMGHGAGRTIGTIYAWGAIGSIVGTFVAGFFLVAWIGTEGSILLIAGVLALVGLFYGYRSWLPYAFTAAYAGVMVCALGSWSSTQAVGVVLGLRDRHESDIVFKKDSNYQRVVVRTAVGNPDERKMVLDKLIHSRVNMKDPLEMKYHYEKVYAEVMRRRHPSDDPVTAMVIGGGGYVFPRYLEIAYPGSYVEVSEIDPVVTEAAFEAFGLPEDTAIHYYNMDARNRVADLIRRKRAGETVPVFDFIFGDSINDFSVPYHLTTLEFNRLLDELMSDDGVYMLNMIDMLASGRFLGAVINTCREVFPNVYVFNTEAGGAERDTFIVVNAKRPLNMTNIVDAIRLKGDFPGGRLTSAQLDRLAGRSDGVVLTDDFAPVENLLAEVVRRYKPEEDTEKTYIEESIRLIDNGEFGRAAALCREALERDPAALRAHFYLGVALARQGKIVEAIGEYREELKIDPSHVASYVNIGLALMGRGDWEGAVRAYRTALRLDPVDAATRCHLGQALFRLGRLDEAASEYRGAIRIRPGYTRAHHDLGVLLLRRGELEAAISSFEEVLKLAPDYPGVHDILGSALIRAGRPQEATAHLRRAAETEPGRAGTHNLLGQALADSGNLTAGLDAFSRAVQLEPSNPDYRTNLGFALEQLGRAGEAIAQYKESLRLKEENPQVMNALAWLLATSADDTARDGAEAVRWAERLCQMIGQNSPEVLDTLAASYAEAGRYEDAVKTAQRSLDLASRDSQPDLAEQIRARLELFQAGRPYRE
ncbi:MAG: fused MFS/spermidine synthase [Phycisphaerales bacterium]|nr:MAG: fused MFS/spermidine synthase [Phycisphaerales bacterium]